MGNRPSLLAHASGLRLNENHPADSNIDNSLSIWNG
jgi:hypothetical protein